jgi:cell division protein ZapA (FtsZ GTPase activity inhibitor)
LGFGSWDLDLGIWILEFEILGQRLKFKADGADSCSPEQVVALVKSEIERIQTLRTGLNDTQLAILAALKIASEKIEADRDYKNHLGQLKSSARDALTLIEEVVPSVQ